MPAGPPAERTPRVLVLDDDPDLVVLVARVLTREGFHVTTAATFAEAVARCQEKDPPQLLLVDLSLPDIEREAIPAALHARGIDIPFCVLTGQGSELLAVRMMKEGAVDYLVKEGDFLTFMPTRLRMVLRQVAQQALLRQAEWALKREHAFISAVLETAGALVLVLDPQGRILRMNRAAEDLTGYATPEVAGKSFRSHLVPAEEQNAVGQLLARLSHGEPRQEQVHRIRTRSGGERSVTWSHTVLPDSTGGVEYLVVTGVDITERKQLEAELLESSVREQRRASYDLHDRLGQQLAAIELRCQCLVEALEEQPAVAAQVAAISGEVRASIGQIRDLARSIAPADLEENFAAALELLCKSTAGDRGIRCKVQWPAGLEPRSAVTANHIYRIIQEALSNAVRHGRPTRIQVSVFERGSRMVLSVLDNGAGFAPSASSGMGLRLMRYRSEMIRGRLEIRPRNPGTEITCSWPRELMTPAKSGEKPATCAIL